MQMLTIGELANLSEDQLVELREQIGPGKYDLQVPTNADSPRIVIILSSDLKHGPPDKLFITTSQGLAEVPFRIEIKLSPC
jgi:hypothetical protein